MLIFGKYLLALISIGALASNYNLNGAGGGGTVTDVTGTSPINSSGGNTPDISIDQADATTNGFLTFMDWNTFNNKQDALPTFTAGSVIFSDGATLDQDNTNFFWDDTTNRLGIGTNGPDSPLSFGAIFGSKIGFYDGFNIGIGVQANLLEFIGDAQFDDFTFGHGSSGSLTRLMTIKGTGNVGIGTTSPSLAKLQVEQNGTSYQTLMGLYNSSSTGIPYHQIGKSNASGESVNFGFNTSISDGSLWISGDDQATGKGIHLKLGGNMGIGAIDPQQKLHIAATGSEAAAYIRFAHRDFPTTAAWDMGRENAFTGDFQIHRIDGSAVDTIPLSIKLTNGNMGIGTVSPTAHLHIVNDEATEVATIVQGFSSQSSDLMQWQDDASTVLAYVDSTGAVGTHTLNLNGSTSGTLTILPDAVTSSYAVTMPATQGGVDTFLKNDGSGGLTWDTIPGTGTVTSVGLSVPGTSIFGVSGSPVTTSGTLGLTTTGTSGGIPYFSSTSQIASSAALTTNALVLGGGAGTTPASLGSLGTTTTVLHGNAAGAPTFGAIVNSDITNSTIDLTAKVTGALPIANGGTNNGSLSVSAGAVYYGDGSKLVALAPGTSTYLLQSNGTSAPSWVAPTSGGATLVASATWGANAGCFWTYTMTSAATWYDVGTNGSCLDPSVTGGASVPATHLPDLVYNSMPTGDYIFVIRSQFDARAGGYSSWQLTDGTNNYYLGGTIADSASGFTGSVHVGSSGNKTFRIQSSGGAPAGVNYIHLTTTNEALEIYVYKL